MRGGFSSHILSQIYSNNELDALFLLDEFNFRLGPRLGSLRDYYIEVDNIRPREILDFAEFLTDVKLCVFNGRYGE